MTLPSSKKLFCSSVASLLLVWSNLSAQEFRLSAEQMNYSTLAKKVVDNRPVSMPSVDPDVYLLGPGDALEIRSSKMPWVQYSGIVNESGILYIPEFGTFNVDKKTLNASKTEITKLISRQNPADEIDIILSSPKQVEVVVTGEGVKSGSYRLSGTMRILDAIQLALKDSVSLFRDVNIRNVDVSVGGISTNYDLAGFIATGKGGENPYLYPGAIITLSPPTRWITVSGAVSGAFPDVIPLRANERYKDIFTLYKFTDNADTGNIKIYRKGFSPGTYTQASIANMVAENCDYVIVGSLLSGNQPANVSVSGEIRNPGTYPLESGVKAAWGVVAMAGGITERGDSDRVYIVRKDPLGGVAPRLAKSSGTTQVKNDQMVGNMTISGDYRIIPLHGSSSEVLESGDEIVVPEVTNTVHLSGNVKIPGAYKFTKNRSASYYVGLAGGFARNADRKSCKIVTAYGNHWIVKTTPIEAGDIIVVPERPAGEKARNISLVMSAFYYTALTILAGINIGDKFNLFPAN